MLAAESPGGPEQCARNVKLVNLKLKNYSCIPAVWSDGLLQSPGTPERCTWYLAGSLVDEVSSPWSALWLSVELGR